MTDDKKRLDELDWDQALAEWETTTFVPEVAPEPQTEKAAALAGTAVSRPLYRPPTIASPTLAPAPQPAPASPRAQQSARSLQAAFGEDLDEDAELPRNEDDQDATLIAAIPLELLRVDDTPAKPSSRGGFGQLFSRDAAGGAKAAPPVESTVHVDDGAPVDSTEGHFASEFPPLTPPSEAAEVASAASLGVLEVPDDEHPLEALGGPPSARPARLSTAPPRAEVLDEGGSVPSSAAEDSALSGAADAEWALPSRSWHEEKPASAWMDEASRAATEERATWLEEEARALSDPVRRARGLLACSELRANLDDRARAHTLATEACASAPTMALPHRQARALIPWPPDPEEYAEALDAEIRMTAGVPARLHSTLLAAEALFARGDDDAAEQRLLQAERLFPDDLRAIISRAARALGQGDTGSDALSLGDGPGLGPLRNAIVACQRLRGVAVARSEGEPLSLNELVLLARTALDRGESGTAAELLADIARLPELALGARWLAAALGAPSLSHRRASVRWLRELVELGEENAWRPLVARALELGDAELVNEAIEQPGVLTSAERVTLATLIRAPLVASDPDLDVTEATDGLRVLACAVAAVGAPPDQARAHRTAGSPQTRAHVELGRLLGGLADASTLAPALAALGEEAGPVAKGIALELAHRERRFTESNALIEEWSKTHAADQGAATVLLLQAILAERSRDIARAVEKFRAVRELDPSSESALRALASLEPVDLVSEMNAVADECAHGIRSALARIEAVARGEAMLAEPTQAHLLERAFRAAPDLPFASFLGERIARRSGEVEDVLRWVRDRARRTNDPVESALEAVREALLIADQDPNLAAVRLREAHLVRPGDVALRELYERMSPLPPDDRASWREQRASASSPEARVLFSLQAAHEYERLGDDEGAFRCSVAAASTEAPLGRIARERAELASGRVARLADELLAAGKSAEDPRSRREAYERLAILDESARHDGASALLWHRSILEEFPTHRPSLRHIEHQIIGEARSEEIEPILTAIARALRGAGAGEATAHAEVAARLLLRNQGDGSVGALEMIEAALEVEPSLSILRTVDSLARVRRDDVALLTSNIRLAERATRAAETATLLVRASEAATRLGRMDEARTLLERASVEDAGDVTAFARLAELRLRSGDPRGAAEALEALARGSRVREHQLLAWTDAGRVWQEAARDELRAVSALESAAAIDVAHSDVFDRLSRLYASQRMQSELAELLEKRIERVTDPDERLAIEVRRGRILLESGEVTGARRAFQAALAQRPDDPDALSAFADLCMAQNDWEAAEQALVRLTRLLQDPDEQRSVYESLGELYSTRLLNLSRAELALKEVRKRAPDDVGTAEKLIEVYKRQNDPARAVELQQELVDRAQSPDERRTRTMDLSVLLESTARDPRRAEKVLESARREFPYDSTVLRALADFYARHQQTPAVNILLDRASAEARRSVASGKLTVGPFEILAASYDFRGRPAAARVIESVFAAVEGLAADLGGAAERAVDAALDELIAPAVFTPAVRALLAITGEAFDAAYPLNPGDLHGTPLAPDAFLSLLASRVAARAGVPTVRVLSSPALRGTCVAISRSPLVLAVAENVVGAEGAAAFLVVRALKMAFTNLSVLARIAPVQLPVVLAGWIKCFNPAWEPRGVAGKSVDEAALRIGAALRSATNRTGGHDVALLALEAAAIVDGPRAELGSGAIEWGNRVALLALGELDAGFDAIAFAAGANTAPSGARDRTAFVIRTPEARDLVSFAVSDAFFQVRSRLGLGS